MCLDAWLRAYLFRRICNPAVVNCGFAIRVCLYIYLMAVWFERIANPYSTFRRIANPPKHITDSLNCSWLPYTNRQNSTRQSSSLHWGGLGRVSNWPSFAFQKTMNCTLKGHVLQYERRSFATRWTPTCYVQGAFPGTERPLCAMKWDLRFRADAGRAMCKRKAPKGDNVARRVGGTPYLITRAWNFYP